MTRHEKLIQKALDYALDKDPSTLQIILELVSEYRIAIDQALKLEETIKAYMKDGEKVLLEMRRK